MRASTPQPMSKSQLQAAAALRVDEVRRSSGQQLGRAELARQASLSSQRETVPSMAAVAAPGSAEATTQSNLSVSTPMPDTVDPDSNDFNRKTGEYEPMPSYAITASGERLGPWTFARLMEALATGQVGRGDRLNYMGRGFAPIDSIDELERFLPVRTATTSSLDGPGLPDYRDSLLPTSDGIPAMLTVPVAIARGARDRRALRRARRRRDRAGAAQGDVLHRRQAQSRRLDQHERDARRVPGAARHAGARGARSRAGRAAQVQRPHGRHAHRPGPGRAGRHLPRHPRAGARPRGRELHLEARRGQLLPRAEGAARGVPRSTSSCRRCCSPASRRRTRRRRRSRCSASVSSASSVRRSTIAAGCARSPGRRRSPASCSSPARPSRSRNCSAPPPRDGTGDAADALRAVELLLAARMLEWK